MDGAQVGRGSECGDVGADWVVLRWMTRQQMMGAFQEVCFSMPVSTCAAPNYKEIKVRILHCLRDDPVAER